MLKFINRLEKTRNVVILIFAVLMVVSLVFWGGSGIGGTANVDPARSTETAASVSGEDITVGELFRQKQMYSRFSQGRPYPAKMLLDGMIASRITRVEAERPDVRYGLTTMCIGIGMGGTVIWENPNWKGDK